MLTRRRFAALEIESPRAQKVCPLRAPACGLLTCFMAFSAHRIVSYKLQYRLRVCWATGFPGHAGANSDRERNIRVA